MWIRVQYVISVNASYHPFSFGKGTSGHFYNSSALLLCWEDWENRKCKSNKLPLPLASGVVKYFVGKKLETAKSNKGRP